MLKFSDHLWHINCQIFLQAICGANSVQWDKNSKRFKPRNLTNCGSIFFATLSVSYYCSIAIRFIYIITKTSLISNVTSLLFFVGITNAWALGLDSFTKARQTADFYNGLLYEGKYLSETTEASG